MLKVIILALGIAQRAAADCYEDSGDSSPIAGCWCHPTCASCGYYNHPTSASDCITCTDQGEVTAVYADGTGTCDGTDCPEHCYDHDDALAYAFGMEPGQLTCENIATDYVHYCYNTPVVAYMCGSSCTMNYFNYTSDQYAYDNDMLFEMTYGVNCSVVAHNVSCAEGGSPVVNALCPVSCAMALYEEPESEDDDDFLAACPEEYEAVVACLIENDPCDTYSTGGSYSYSYSYSYDDDDDVAEDATCSDLTGHVVDSCMGQVTCPECRLLMYEAMECAMQNAAIEDLGMECDFAGICEAALAPTPAPSVAPTPKPVADGTPPSPTANPTPAPVVLVTGAMHVEGMTADEAEENKPVFAAAIAAEASVDVSAVEVTIHHDDGDHAGHDHSRKLEGHNEVEIEYTIEVADEAAAATVSATVAAVTPTEMATAITTAAAAAGVTEAFAAIEVEELEAPEIVVVATMEPTPAAVISDGAFQAALAPVLGFMGLLSLL